MFSCLAQGQEGTSQFLETRPTRIKINKSNRDRA
jgi:hypothetical protein